MEEMLQKRKTIEEARSSHLEGNFKLALSQAAMHLEKALNNGPEKKEKCAQILNGLKNLGILDLTPHIERMEVRLDKKELFALKKLLEKEPIPWEKIEEEDLTDAGHALLSLINDED